MNDQSFFSADRLIEFGMGMAMAQQMVDMMNRTMQQMHVPGSIHSMPHPIQQPQTYYVVIDGQQVGPLNDSEIAQLAQQKRIHKDTQAWVPGMPTWKSIQEVPAILKIIALTPPPLNS
ncbi:MAG: DUF4339 domain-containing protein [Prevotellaceae bacterium]|nr:DUF4339 domain-containing protein [Prevotellaceae bacterium]